MRNAILFGAIAVGVFAASLTYPSTSSASPYIRYGVQDDAYLGSGQSLEANLETLDRLGVKLVRFTINWRQVAQRKPARAANPGDPAYDWSQTDAILNGLHKHRIAVLATLYGTPAWANGGGGVNVIPRSKSSFAAFALAAAKRYPWLKMWEIWNEPNLRRFLSPNSPALYVQRLLNPTYAVLHAFSSSNRVAGGATSPRPTPSGLSPIAFMRGMRQAHARLDVQAGLRRQADLADRVRLPDEPAGPVRRLDRAPDAIRVGGGSPRKERAVRRRADPLHRQGRACALRLAERLPHPLRCLQAGLLRLHAPDRPGIAAR